MSEEELKTIRNYRLVLLFILGVIAVSLIAYGIQIYLDLKPVMLDDSDIKITEAKGELENEKILTVNTNSEAVVLYSFDNGKTYQSDNNYSISENRDVYIVLKDNEKRVVGKKKYSVKVVDDQGPTITIDEIPSVINKGDNIDINSKATATDSKNNNLNVNVTSNIDANKEGTYNVTYDVVDENNMKATVTVEVKVVDKDKEEETKEEPKPSSSPKPSESPTPSESPKPSSSPKPEEKPKVTYYRYRTRSTRLYDCNYYDCSYLDYDNKTDGSYSFNEDSLCYQNNNPNYSIYNNICYNNKSLDKTECSNKELSLNNFCYEINSYATFTCPSGFVNEENICYKQIKMTCNSHCTSTTWSEWSNWSTTKIVASENTEVQTKVE